jgi:acyl-CoA thioester hydrolase
MDYYQENITVEEKHLDDHQHVNNVVFLQFVQDVSKNHWLSRTNDEINAMYFWVVKSHHIDYKKQVFLGDELIAKTHVAGYKGPFSERVVEFYHENELVSEARSNWCLLGRNDHKPKRIPDEIQLLF